MKIFQHLNSIVGSENPIVGSLLRELDIKKKQSDSDFIKSLPSHRGKEFEIKKKLHKLRGKNNTFSNNNNNNNNNKNNNNNNNNNNNSNLFGPGGEPLSMPTIEDFLDGPPHPFLPPPPTAPPSVNIQNTLFGPTAPVFPPTSNSDLDINAQPIRTALPKILTRGIGNDLFGSQAATAFRENKIKTETQQEVNDFLFEMPEKKTT